MMKHAFITEAAPGGLDPGGCRGRTGGPLRWGLSPTALDPTALDCWAALEAPSRFVAIAWHGVVSVAALTVVARAVAVVWRSARQTLD